MNENFLGNNQSYEGLLQVTKKIKRNWSSEKKKDWKNDHEKTFKYWKMIDIHYNFCYLMTCLSTDATLTSQKIVFLFCTVWSITNRQGYQWRPKTGFWKKCQRCEWIGLERMRSFSLLTEKVFHSSLKQRSMYQVSVKIKSDTYCTLKNNWGFWYFWSFCSLFFFKHNLLI